MGEMYSWATPEYLLYHMSIDQIVMYYERGQRHKKRDLEWSAREVSIRNAYYMAGKSYDVEIEKHAKETTATKQIDEPLKSDTVFDINKKGGLDSFISKNLIRG